jgi:hypothetical protein
MTISRKNAQLAQTISVSGNAVGDTIIIPSSGIVNISGVLNVNGTGVSVSGHTHLSTDITDFNEAVDDRVSNGLLVAGTGINLSYDDAANTLNIGVTSSPRLVTTVLNKTGSSIPKFRAVYINGGQGDQATITLAANSGEASSSKTYGVTAQAIDHMGTGDVVVYGLLTGVNTDQFNPTAPVGDVNGTTLYLDSSSGLITKTKPYAPNHIVAIGTIVRTHQNDGSVEVRIQNGFELEELHNVAVTGVTNGQFLQYNSSSGLWLPSSSGNFTSLTVNNTGVSLSGHTHTASQITDFNSSVSGLLPVKNIIAGSGIGVSSDSGAYTISVTGTFGLTSEEVDDRVGNLLVAGTGINLSYNDNSNTLSINLATSVVSGYEVLSSGKSVFTVSQGYLSNNLNVYINGSKLVLGEDYTASNGSTFVLTQTAISGDIVEWQGLGGPAEYSQLNHTHTSSDITNFNSSVSGLLSYSRGWFLS